MTTTTQAVIAAVQNRLETHASMIGVTSKGNTAISQDVESFDPRHDQNYLIEVGASQHRWLNLERVNLRIHVICGRLSDPDGEADKAMEVILERLSKIRELMHNTYLGGVLTVGLRYRSHSKPVPYRNKERFWYAYVDFEGGAETSILEANTTADGVTIDRG